MLRFFTTLIIFAWLSGTHFCLPFGKQSTSENQVADAFKFNNAATSRSRAVKYDVAKRILNSHCANAASIKCADPDFCIELIHCDCEPGWTGFYCATPCSLPCVHGSCLVNEYPSDPSLPTQYCNCPFNYEGELCQVESKQPFSFAFKR